MQKRTISFEALWARCHSRLLHLATRPQHVSADTACAAEVILLLGEGQSYRQAAAVCGLSPSRVETIRRRFLVHGIGGLSIPVRTANTPEYALARMETEAVQDPT